MHRCHKFGEDPPRTFPDTVLTMFGTHDMSMHRLTDGRTDRRTDKQLMPNTHRRRRRDETVLLRRVGGVNTICN